MDYSKANYNALELSVSDAPQTELSIGGTAINLSLRSEGQTEAFTAELDDMADHGGGNADRAQRARADRRQRGADQRLAFWRRSL